ncbi:hypothetical protein GCM10028801_30760 [Nocardioides maradonensis]
MLSGAEFRISREFIGLSREAFADHLGVKQQLVAQWDQGRSRVPPGVESELARLRSQSDVLATQLADDVRTGRRQLLRVPMGVSGAFQRAVVGRVLRLVAVEVDYLPG